MENNHPAISAGSIIEVNGDLFSCDSEEAISTTDPVTTSLVADGKVYIMVDPSTGLAYFTATVPVWNDLKQGWYGETTWATWRYIGGAKKATSSYSNKFVYDGYFRVPQYYQSDMQYYDFSGTGFGTHTFTKTFDYDIEAVLFSKSGICSYSAMSDPYIKYEESHSIVESIIINNNILTAIVYFYVNPINTMSYRLSLETCIIGN